MIQSFILAVQVVFPLLIYMGIGFIIRKCQWMSEASMKEMNTVVFKVFLSTMIFYNIYESNLKEDFQIRLLIYAIIVLLVMFLILNIIVPMFIHDRSIVPVIIQGIYRSNFVLFGLQITASICGDTNLGMATVLISVIIPMFNVLAVILFETYRHEKISIKRLGYGIITNPLIIASVLGLVVSMIQVNLPDIAEGLLATISKMATPLSLILLGGTITLEGVKKYWKYTCVCSLARLIIIPGIFVTIGALIGFRGEGLVALMVMLASPTAVSSFTMAAQMGGNEKLAGQIVATTTVLSTITIFIWTYLLSVFQLI